MNNNIEKFNELRNKYKLFKYNNYEYNISENYLNIKYYYEIENLDKFVTTWTINIQKNNHIDDGILNNLIFNLGMVELISYWKMTCANDILIECYNINEEQNKWWKKLYINGLSEFFYTNGINFLKEQMNITSNGKFIEKNNKLIIDNNEVLIPIGGGKDSITSLELLKNKFYTYCYIINNRKATDETFKVSNLDTNKLILAQRNFDKKILEYNKKGFLNGHTPFSAIVAFSSVIACYINGIKYVALSNESSANEATVIDTNVNHQYSKSIEFENDFREYEKKYINSTVEYFSFLRPLSESGIARIFSKFNKYHKIFKSCNVGSKEDIWCLKCAKCLFVFIILSPFLTNEELVNIFGVNMLDNIELKPIFDKLIGKEKEKPFECVGSRDEVNASLTYLINKYKNNNLQMPKLLSYYDELDDFKNYNLKTIYSSFDENNNLPKEFIDIIKDYINE